MNSNVLSFLSLSIILFFSFYPFNKIDIVKKHETINILPLNEKDCTIEDVQIIYKNILSPSQITDIRLYYRDKYNVHINLTLSYFQMPSLNNFGSFNLVETWSICYPNKYTQPGNGGINKEIDDDPDIDLLNNPNAM